MNPPDHDGSPAAALPAAGADPITLVVGVHLVLTGTGGVLLGRRRNTTYANGQWHLPAGHMQAGETVTGSMCREADEELGISVREEDLVLVHTLHHLDPDDGRSRLQLFFRPTRYDGHLRNAEPHKCQDLRWWPLDVLPAQTVPYTAHALAQISAGRALSVVGWTA
ncbi:NUDIX domain-containing protein [Kitasatospora sp. NPDC047058]|uniref:NUDIX hydrolase n=1 Tax=Kitasatospora sp. NPDC047058 TaxID=3155620 RepID=UPI0033EFC47B